MRRITYTDGLLAKVLEIASSAGPIRPAPTERLFSLLKGEHWEGPLRLSIEPGWGSGCVLCFDPYFIRAENSATFPQHHTNQALNARLKQAVEEHETNYG